MGKLHGGIKMDIISTRYMKREFIEKVIEETKKMDPIAASKRQLDTLKGKTLVALFFEPSTRTNLSFTTAMKMLGGNVIGFDDPRTSSVKKGETLADTIRVVQSYANAIVMRHPNEGAAALATEFANVPIINAGDGSNQHPTQALLDLYTILKEKNTLDGLEITLAGDLKYGRTIHSLAYALSKFDVSLIFASPPSLRIQKWIIDDLKSAGIPVKETDNIETTSDVLYLTRIQKERFPDIEEYQKVSSAYVLDEESLEKIGSETMIMHPLPRVNEITADVDKDKRAKYFVQSAYGIPTRMALLSMVMGD